MSRFASSVTLITVGLEDEERTWSSNAQRKMYLLSTALLDRLIVSVSIHEMDLYIYPAIQFLIMMMRLSK